MPKPIAPKVLIARAIRQMCPALREQYDSLRRLLATATAADVKARYRVAQLVAEIKTREDRYGARAVPLLAAALRRDESTLYRYATVAETWDETALADVMLMRLPNREPLSWSHLLELAAVTSPETRERLLQETLAAGLSVRALAALSRGEPVRGASAPELHRLERMAGVEELVTRRFVLDDALVEGLNAFDGAEAAALVSRAMAAQEAALHILEANLAKLRQIESRMHSRSTPRLRAAAPIAKSSSFPRLLAGGVR